MVQKHDQNIAKEFQKIKSNNPECDELYKIIGEPYNEAVWNKMKEQTALFKLSWKYQYPLEKNGKPTFYGMLLKRKLS